MLFIALQSVIKDLWIGEGTVIVLWELWMVNQIHKDTRKLFTDTIENYYAYFSICIHFFTSGINTE